LIERIRALLRRQKFNDEKNEESDKKSDEIVTRGELVLDDGRHICTWKGKRVNLTVTEYLLVKALAQRPGHVKNRDQLMDMAYGENIYVDDRTIDSHIKRVRKKFKDVDDDFSQIETLYGVGYRYKEE
jgi:two-component system response regulator ChvI